MLWLALICGDFLILFKKIVTFLDFLRHCFQFCCMYFGWSIPSKKNLCISGRENVLWLGCKTGHWTRTLSLFNFPALDTLLPNGNTETTPTRCYLPWEKAGMRSPKISIRRAIFPGKILLCCQSNERSLPYHVFVALLQTDAEIRGVPSGGSYTLQIGIVLQSSVAGAVVY